MLGLLSCDSDLNDPSINFVGDSIIARWDIDGDFPSYYTHNYGVGGSGLELLNSYNSKFFDTDVVVISGTNDNRNFTNERREEYAQKYLNAILALTNKRIYLFSLLPRKIKGDRENLNEEIATFNLLIYDLVQEIERISYINVYDDFMNGKEIDTQYFCDGLHPNLRGYEILTQKLLQAL